MNSFRYSKCKYCNQNLCYQSCKLIGWCFWPIPTFLTKTCEYLVGKTIYAETILGCIEVAQTEVIPISGALVREK